MERLLMVLPGWSLGNPVDLLVLKELSLMEQL